MFLHLCFSPSTAASATAPEEAAANTQIANQMFDAAQAFATIERDPGQRLATVAEPLAANPAVTDAAFAAYNAPDDLDFAPTAAEGSQLSPASVSEAESSDGSWLSEELLERVFG